MHRHTRREFLALGAAAPRAGGFPWSYVTAAAGDLTPRSVTFQVK